MKAILIILSLFFLSGCKSKKVLKKKTSEKETVQVISEKNEEKQIEKTKEKQEAKKVDLAEQKKESQTEIEIKGKAEDNKPIELFNIENGDTIQSIKVTGNAEVFIRSKNSKSDQVKKENLISESSNKLEEISRNIVKEVNLKETGKEIKNTAKEVTKKGFQAGVWIVISISVIVLILIFFTYKYFKK